MIIGPQIGPEGLSNILQPIKASGAKRPSKDGTCSFIVVLAESWGECSSGERRVRGVSVIMMQTHIIF